MKGFEILDHTADVGIRATVDTLAEAFASTGVSRKVAHMCPMCVVKG